MVYTVGGGLTQHAFVAEGTRIAKGSLEPGANSTSAHSFRSRFSLIDRYPVGLGGEQVTEFFGGGSETCMHSSTCASGKLVATCVGCYDCNVLRSRYVRRRINPNVSHGRQGQLQ